MMSLNLKERPTATLTKNVIFVTHYELFIIICQKALCSLNRQNELEQKMIHSTAFTHKIQCLKRIKKNINNVMYCLANQIIWTVFN